MNHTAYTAALTRLLEQLVVFPGVPHLRAAPRPLPLDHHQPRQLRRQRIGVVPHHLPPQHHLREQLVPRGGHGRPLGMLLPLALRAVGLQVDLLPRAQACQENALVDGADGRRVHLRLTAGEGAGRLLRHLHRAKKGKDGQGTQRIPGMSGLIPLPLLPTAGAVADAPRSPPATTPARWSRPGRPRPRACGTGGAGAARLCCARSPSPPCPSSRTWRGPRGSGSGPADARGPRPG